MPNIETADETEVLERYKFITMLGRAFGRDVDEPLLLAYRMGLQDVPLLKFRAACGRAIGECDRMPTVKELRVLAGVAVSTETRAILAFEVLGKSVSKVGAYRSIVFDDPILNATIGNLGGWEAICDAKADEWESFFRQRFLKAYAANLEMKRGTMYAQLGICDRENGGNGFETKPPVMVATELPKVPGLSYERPKPIASILGECVAMIGVEPKEGAT